MVARNKSGADGAAPNGAQPAKAQPGDVIKRLAPGAPGTQRLLERYRDALVCVRYREDAQRPVRYTTIELIIDQRPSTRGNALVRIGFDETDLRQRIKQAGGTWVASRRLWQVPRSAIRALQLRNRIVPDAH